MRWTVMVFVAAVTIFVATTVGMADDGQTSSRLGDEERVGVAFAVNTTQADSGTEPGGTNVGTPAEATSAQERAGG